MKTSFCSILVTLALFTTSTSFAEKRQHLAHIHGHGLLNIAITDHQVHIELNSPADSLLGFEHHPETEQQHQQVIAFNNTLKNGEELFRFPQKADCHLLSSLIDNPMVEDGLHGDEHHDDAHHGDEHHDDEHHDDEQHDDEQHDDEHQAEHNDIRVQYQFECKNPNHLNTIATTLFTHFPRFEELDVQIVTPQGPQVHELEKAEPKIHLQ